jgi:hypothetical protein
MSQTDTITVGALLPTIARVSAHGAYTVTVTWKGGERSGEVTPIDLAPMILSYQKRAKGRGAEKGR